MAFLQPKTVYLSADKENLSFFQALSSSTRLEIIQLLKQQDLSISQLSKALHLSAAITTRHIKTLEAAGIVTSRMETGKHGLLKMCSLKLHEVQLIFNNDYSDPAEKMFTQIDIPISSYSLFSIQPPCGMAKADHIYGEIDDPRYFSSPKRHDLSLIWFTSGFLQYPIPIYDVDLDRLSELEISLEICSEYPGFNNSFLSDIYFSLNELPLGRWISPGDFGGRKGRYTPMWWNLGTEYGLLKKIHVSSSGVEIDGMHLSDRPLKEYISGRRDCFDFRIECPKDTDHPGGCNLFGRHFGDYDQNIIVKCYYQN